MVAAGTEGAGAVVGAWEVIVWFRVERAACQELGTGTLNSEPGTLN